MAKVAADDEYIGRIREIRCQHIPERFLCVKVRSPNQDRYQRREVCVIEGLL